MEETRIIDTLPTPEDCLRLRKSVGWRELPREAVEIGMRNSHFGVCAWRDGRMVGMARVAGDGGMVFYIQDVIVEPEYQGLGIGALMMDRVMAYLQKYAYDNSNVSLMAAVGKEPFYEKYGFITRPSPSFGAGMTRIWKRDK